MKSRQLNPHIALSVAAGLAHQQLAAQPNKFYDGEHYSELMNMVAHALMRVAPLYVADAEGAERRCWCWPMAARSATSRCCATTCATRSRFLPGLA